MHHASLIMHHASRIMNHSSCITHHASCSTHHSSCCGSSTLLMRARPALAHAPPGVGAAMRCVGSNREPAATRHPSRSELWPARCVSLHRWLACGSGTSAGRAPTVRSLKSQHCQMHRRATSPSGCSCRRPSSCTLEKRSWIGCRTCASGSRGASSTRGRLPYAKTNIVGSSVTWRAPQSGKVSIGRRLATATQKTPKPGSTCRL